MIDALEAQCKGDRLMKKNSTVAKNRNENFKQPKLTIGLDLGDRFSHYCILDEAGKVILEHHLPTTPKGIHQVFRKIRAAGSHSRPELTPPGSAGS
jgi:hypothetical protein